MTNALFRLADRDPENIRNVVLDLERRLQAVENGFVFARSASEIVQDIGDLDYRVYDDDGVARVVLSAHTLLGEFGVDANIAAFDPTGQPTFYVDADTGKVFAAGTINAAGGSFGGWSLDATKIESFANETNNGIVLDSSVPIIRVGVDGGDHTQIDGANQRIRSSNFVSGASGFNIDTATGDAEYNNIKVRGELRTSILSAGSRIVTAGDWSLSPDAGKLASDVSDSDTEVDFGQAMNPGDWIRLQGPDATGSLSTEWMLVSNNVSGTIYEVTRDIDGSGANAWPADTPYEVVGQPGDSRIEMTSGATAEIRLVTQGETWDHQIIQASMSTERGAIVAGNGSIELNTEGLFMWDAGDALTFYDSVQSLYGAVSMQTRNADAGLWFLIYQVSDEDNQITNGDFETGDLTGWTETDPENKLSVELEGQDGGYCLFFEGSTATQIPSIQQNVSLGSAEGVVITFRAKTGPGPGDVDIISQLSGGQTRMISMPPGSDWRTCTIVHDDGTTSIKLSFEEDCDIYVDNIVVRPLSAGGKSIRFTPEGIRTDADYEAAADVTVTPNHSYYIGDSDITQGWIPVQEAWTRTGDHQFTVPGNLTSVYRPGTKVKYTDGGSTEYGVIASSSHAAGTTTVTLITNSDYAMAAATINNRYISYIENPEGFPDWFNYTITWGASGSMTYTSVATAYSKWRSEGGSTLRVIGRGSGTTGGTASTTLTASLPVTPTLSASLPVGTAYTQDPPSASVTGFSFVTTVVNVRKYDSSNYGLGASRIAVFDVVFEF